MLWLMHDIPVGPRKWTPSKIRTYKHVKSAVKRCQKIPGSYVLDEHHKLVASNFPSKEIH